MRVLTRGRLVRIALAFALAGCAGSSATHTSRAAASKPAAAAPLPHNAAVVNVTQRATSRAIAPGFLGFSFENNAILPYAGTDPHAVNPLFEQLIRNLNPGQSPDIRIGGDSSDWAWVPVRGLAKPGGVRVTLTPQWMAVTHALASSLNARLILGIDLEANSRRLAAAEANAFEKNLGKSSIEALEPGNEPELYPSFSWYVASNGQGVKGRPPSYDFNAFLGDFTSFARVLPGPLAGPTTGAPKWMAHTGQFLAAEPRVKVVTLHRYPVQTCYIRKSSPQYPTAAHLLAPYATTREANSVVSFVRIAHARHLPLRIDEMNTDSCGKAPGVSDAFVSSLWAVDALFEMARVGVDGVNMHTYPGATYQMFTFTQQGNKWRTSVKPEYYGLMMFAQAAPAGSRLVATSAKNARGIKTWATHAADGHTRVVLINQSLNRRVVALNGASAAGGPATLTRLKAPRLSSTSGVTLGGQHFGATTGTLTGHSDATQVSPQGGRYVFSLPAHSAVLVTY
jgi:hypothetical protein